MGAEHNYRYVNATNVYAKGKADGVTVHDSTYTFASGSTGAKIDLGVNHSYRYVNAANVYAKGKADGVTTHTTTYTFASGSTGGKIDLGANHSYRYVDATNVYNKGKADGKAQITTIYTFSRGDAFNNHADYSYPPTITVNVKSLYPSTYNKYTTSNFYFVVTRFSGFGDKENRERHTAAANVSWSYAASTGLLTISGLSAHAGGDDSLDITISSGYVVLIE